MVGDGFLLMYDVVKGTINGASPNEVVAGDVILLPDTMDAVFALATIGIRPRKLNERDTR